jgi:hypothetical protein
MDEIRSSVRLVVVRSRGGAVVGGEREVVTLPQEDVGGVLEMEL